MNYLNISKEEHNSVFFVLKTLGFGGCADKGANCVLLCRVRLVLEGSM